MLLVLGRLVTFGLQIPVQPAVRGALETRRPGFHVVLRVEVRPRAVGRSAGVDDRQLAAIPPRLQRLQARIQAEEPVEIDCAAAGGVAGLGDGDAGPGAVVLRVAERYDHVETVYGAALEDGDQPARTRRSIRCEGGAREERRREAKADEGERAVF